MKRVPRVLFIAPSAYPLGGVAVWLNSLVCSLPQYGWTPIVGLVSGRWHCLDRYKATYPTLPIVEVSNRTGSAEGRVRALMRTLRSVTPDVAVGVNIADLYSATRRLGKDSGAIRTVMSLHGIAEDLLGDVNRESDHLDAVVATNELSRRLCVDYAGIPATRALYAPYGVDVEALSSLPRRSGQDVLNVAWVGRLSQDQKRIQTIVPILCQLDKSGVAYHFRLAGDGPQREMLLDALKPWLDLGRVEYLGPLPPERLGAEVYAGSDALLLTSSWETGPIVAWEAMAAGVVVVSSRYTGCGLEGSLRHGENCLMFEVGDAAEAVFQLAKVCDPQLRDRLSAAGYALVKERYSLEASAKAWAQSLDTVTTLPPTNLSRRIVSAPPSGRLDRWLGVRFGETVRAAFGVEFEHREPGAEWPHSGHSIRSAGEDILAIAAKIDQPNRS